MPARTCAALEGALGRLDAGAAGCAGAAVWLIAHATGLGGVESTRNGLHRARREGDHGRLGALGAISRRFRHRPDWPGPDWGHGRARSTISVIIAGWAAPALRRVPRGGCFTLDEVADLLFTVDVAVEKATRGTPEHAVARRTQRLIISRLWSELGDLLEDDDGQEESRGSDAQR